MTPASAADGARTTIAVTIAAFAFGLVLLQTTAVNLALPVIRDALGARVDELQWAVSAYAVVVASTLLPAGVICDRLGASRGLVGGLALLIAGATVSATAGSAAGVVVGQGLSGLGAAFVLPASTAVIVEATAPGPSRARAVAILGIGGAVGFGLGPVFSGLVADWIGWRGVFVGPGIVVLAVLLATLAGVPASPRRPRRGPYPLTVLATVAAVGAVAFALIDGNAHGWRRASVVCALLVATLAVGGLVAAGDAGLRALLPRRLVRRPGYRLMLGLGWGHSAGIYGMLFVVALAVPAVGGVSVAVLGLLMVPQALGSACVAPFAARWVARVGARGPMIVGCVGCAVGMAVLVLITGPGSVGFLGLGALIVGISGGTVMQALTTAVTSCVPRDLVGAGTGAFNAFRQLGNVGGVALVGAAAGAVDPIAGLRIAVGVSVAVFALSAVAVVWAWPQADGSAA